MVDRSLLTFAHRLADAADEVSRRYVSGSIPDVSTKRDGTTGTAVDRAVEERILALVLAERATDGFVGEEVDRALEGEPIWIVDGIDGTAAFVARRPEWATLIGLVEHGRVTLGLASGPAMGRRWWAERGTGAWTGATHVAESGSPERLRVSAQVTTGQPWVGMWPPPERVTMEHRSSAMALERRFGCDRPMPWARHAGRSRPSWDSGVAGGALLVASGRLDAFVLFDGGPWDLAATAVIVEEAGGRFSDDAGGTRLDRGIGVFSNGVLHSDVLEALGQHG